MNRIFFIEKIPLFIFTSIVFGFAFFNLSTQVFSVNNEYKFEKVEKQWFSDNISFAVNEKKEGLTSVISFQAIPTPTPTPPPLNSTTGGDEIWEKLAQCESHKNWSANTGNGYYGGLQFSLSAWISTGGTGLPSEANRDEQIMRGKILQERRGWDPWGACSKKLGLF